MPLYEYKCTKCDDEQEHHHKLDAPKPFCSVCGGELERHYSPTSAPKVTTVKGSRLGEPWFDEKEVHALHGERWRETSKEPLREGGARKALYFHD